MSVFYKNKKFIECRFDLESDFEKVIFENYRQLFGTNTILLDVKKKLDSGELGKTIPDGFLFDFSNLEDPRFYLMEIELQAHDFYRHIFTQITKFFGFIRSPNADQAKLIDSLYRIIESNDEYKSQFQKYLGGKELFKFLKDVVENATDILLIIDGKKTEIDEINLVYSETWGKYLKQIICKVYRSEEAIIIHTEPDFEVVEAASADMVEDSEEEQDAPKSYTIDYHLSDGSDLVKDIFSRIKSSFPEVLLNPQHYYIGMNKPAFSILQIRKNLIRIVVFLPIDEVKKIVKSYSISEPGPGVQRFWNAVCTHVRVDQVENINEIIQVLKHAQTFQIIKVR